MKKILILIITLLMVACGDSDLRQKDKDKVTELMLKKDDWKTMGITYRETECVVDEISSNMTDDMWENYVEAMKLESLGFTQIEILERIELTEIEQLQFDSVLYTAVLSFNCISEEKMIEAGKKL